MNNVKAYHIGLEGKNPLVVILTNNPKEAEIHRKYNSTMFKAPYMVLKISDTQKCPKCGELEDIGVLKGRGYCNQCDYVKSTKTMTRLQITQEAIGIVQK